MVKIALFTIYGKYINAQSWTGATLLPKARTLALLPASVGHISHPGTGTPSLEISPQPQSSITVFLQTRKIGRGATHLAREKQITNHRSFTKKISGL